MKMARITTMMAVLVGLLCLAFVPGSVVAQDGILTFELLQGGRSNILYAGQMVRIRIAYENQMGDGGCGSLMFGIIPDEGADPGNVTAEWAYDDSVSFTQQFLNPFDNPSGADSIQVGLVSFDCTAGLPDGYNGGLAIIEFGPIDPAGIGKGIRFGKNPGTVQWGMLANCGNHGNLLGDSSITFLIQHCCQGVTGNFDLDPNNVIDIGDMTAMIGHLFLGRDPLCIEEGNIDGVGAVDVGDFTALTNYIFFDGPLPAPCP